MAVVTHVYTKASHSLAAKLANIGTDALKVILLSAYTPGSTQQTAQYVKDILQADGNWAATTAFTTNYQVNPSNGHYYKVTAGGGGNSGGSAPAWPTGTGSTVVDGALTWTEQGVSIASEAIGTGYTAGGLTLASLTLTDTGLVTTLSCANPSWNAAGGALTASYALFYDSTPGTYATDPVLQYWDFGGAVTSTSTTFTLTISGSGLLTYTAV